MYKDRRKGITVNTPISQMAAEGSNFAKYSPLYFQNKVDFPFWVCSLKVSQTLVNRGCYDTNISRLIIASIKGSGTLGGQELA